MKKLNLKPLGDRVIIKQKEAPKEMSGVVIPEKYQEKYQDPEGTVMAVGPGMQNDHAILRKILKFLLWSFGVSRWKTDAITVPQEFHVSTSMTVKVGDKVRYGRHAGTKIQHDGEEYILVRETDIFYVEE
jgi:chaperonin GroES